MGGKKDKTMNQNHALTAALCTCVCVVLEAGSTPFPAGYCPATDLAVSAVIRQRQATASWTPAAPCVCCLSAHHTMGVKRRVFTLPYIQTWEIEYHWNSATGDFSACIEWLNSTVFLKVLFQAWLLSICWLDLYFTYYTQPHLELSLLHPSQQTSAVESQLKLLPYCFYSDGNLANVCLF